MIFLIQITHLTNFVRSLECQKPASHWEKEVKGKMFLHQWKFQQYLPKKIFIDYEKSHQTNKAKQRNEKIIIIIIDHNTGKNFRIKKEPFIIINMKIRKKKRKIFFCFEEKKESNSKNNSNVVHVDNFRMDKLNDAPK